VTLRPPRFLSRLTLSQQFALESLVVITAFAAVIGMVSVGQIEGMLVTASATGLSSGVNSLIIESIGDGGLATLGAGPTGELDSLVRRDIRSGALSALKVWAPDSAVLYSSDPKDVGRRFPRDTEVTAALRGEVRWVSTLVGRPDDADQVARVGDAVSVYVPIRRRAGMEPIGALEVYLPFAPIREQVARTATWMWVAASMAGALLYLIQVRLVNAASKSLRSTEAEVSKVNRRLEDTLREAEKHSLGTLRALNAAVDAKDSYTARHSLGVADYAIAIGRRVGLTPSQLRDLEQAGLLHDLGKIGVPEAILLKPKMLTREEFLVVCDHSETGARIIESIPSLRSLVPIVRHHHERWDGTGYPGALAGSEIPLLARVLAVADAYEAMTSDRPYRRAMKLEEVRAEFERGMGVQFDPALAQALIDALDAGELPSGEDVA
jgi:hypothetical protein